MSTRRLAAIMFTDIAGYTAMMQENEAQAIVLRQRHREVFERLHGQYRGQIIQYYGDGTLSVFDSAVDAAACAVEMQREFQQEPKVPLRIGIHTGDILLSETEVIGDGVNLASRVESMAEVGSVLVSQTVYDNLKNQPECPAESLGLFTFKNVAKPIEVFALANDGLTVPDPRKLKGKFIKRQSSRPNAWQRLPVAAQYTLGLIAFLALAPFIYAPITSLFDASANDGKGPGLENELLERQGIAFEQKKRLLFTDFETAPEDSALAWTQIMAPMTLGMDLDQDPYFFQLYQPFEPAGSLKDYLERARQYNCEYLVEGKMAREDSAYLLTLSLTPLSATGAPLTFEVSAPDFQQLIDAATAQLKQQLDIPPAHLQQVDDLPVDKFLSDSEPALQALGEAYNMVRQQPIQGFLMMQRPLALDSTFAWAAYNLANFMRAYQLSETKVQQFMGQAMRHRGRLPDIFEARIRQLNYQVNDEPEKAMELTKLFAELEPNNPQYLDALIEQSYVQGQYETCIEAIGQYEAIHGNLGVWATIKARCYLFIGEPEKGLETLAAPLAQNPEDKTTLLQQGELLLALEKWEEAEQIFAKGELLHPDDLLFAQMRKHAQLEGQPEEIQGIALEDFAGDYRAFQQIYVQAPLQYRDGLLILKLPQQPALCLYYTGEGLDFYSPPQSLKITFARDTVSQGLAGYTLSNLRFNQSQHYLKINPEMAQFIAANQVEDIERMAELLPAAKEENPTFPYWPLFEELTTWQQEQGSPDSAALAQLTGTYLGPDNSTRMIVRQKGDKLTAIQEQMVWATDPAVMMAGGERRFLILEALGQFVEFLPAEGQATTMVWGTYGRDRTASFQRVSP